MIDLNLLRSAPYPGTNYALEQEFAPGESHDGYTDQADHVFTYAFYPHAGNFVDSGVIQAAYALNVPLRVVPVAAGTADLPRRRCLCCSSIRRLW